MIPSLLSERSNSTVQTEISCFGPDPQFNFENDKDLEEILGEPKLDIEAADLEGIIPPLEVGKNGVVQRNKIPRLFKKKTAPIIRTFLANIEEYPQMKDKFMRQFAQKLIPGLSDPYYHSLYTSPFHKIYKTIKAKLQLSEGGGEPEEVTVMFSLKGLLYIETEERVYTCKTELWDKLEEGRELKINRGDKLWATLTVEESVDAIAPQTIPQSVIDDLGLTKTYTIENIIGPNDTSFIDIILSIPTLTTSEANDLLTILHNRGLLFPYVRSKVCEIQLSTPLVERKWPELLGRFIFLLDPKWAYLNASLLKKNDVMSIFRHIKQMSGGALYVLQTSFLALSEIKGSDDTLFLWNIFFLSIFQNVTYAKPQSAQKLRAKMEQMWTELKKKAPDSKTRTLSEDVIDNIMQMKEFDMDEPRYSEEEYFNMILTSHLDQILTILDLIPYGKEESNPLYFPVVLSIESALEQARRKDVNDSELFDSESTSSVEQISDYQRKLNARGRREGMQSPRKERGMFTRTQWDSYSSEFQSSSEIHSSRLGSSESSEVTGKKVKFAEEYSSRRGPPELSSRRSKNQDDSSSDGNGGTYSSKRSSRSASNAINDEFNSKAMKDLPPGLQVVIEDEETSSSSGVYVTYVSKFSQTDPYLKKKHHHHKDKNQQSSTEQSPVQSPKSPKQQSIKSTSSESGKPPEGPSDDSLGSVTSRTQDLAKKQLNAK